MESPIATPLTSASVVDDDGNVNDAVIINVTTKTASNKSVSFSNVEIREYARCLGNHPPTTNGPSMSIDWYYEQLDALKVEDYERNRSTRRCIKHLQLPGGLRESIIREHTSCTKKDVISNISDVLVTKHQRKMCFALQEYESWQIIYESLVRKLKRWTFRPNKNKDERRLWGDFANPSKTSKNVMASTNGVAGDDDLNRSSQTILTDASDLIQ